MSSYTATCLVLHRSDFGEYDRILTLFTREKGKISAIAKGSRRARSRLSGGTELFIRARMQLAAGRSLDIITECEIEQSYASIRFDLQRLARATYFCELLNRFTGDRDELGGADLFDLTVDALDRLHNAPGNYPDGIVHAYELHLLAAVGYEPALDRCAVCGDGIGVSDSAFSPSLGGLVCSRDRSRSSDGAVMSAEAVALAQAMQQDVPHTDTRPSVRAAAEIARALRWFVNYRAERSLKSADFLDQLRTDDT